MAADVDVVIWDESGDAGEGGVPVVSPDDLEDLVLTLASNDYLAVELTLSAPNGHSLDILWVRGMDGYAVCGHRGAQPGLRLANPDARNTPDGERRLEYRFGDEVALIPRAEHCAPAVAAKAARYFYAAGTYDPTLRWYDEGNRPVRPETTDIGAALLERARRRSSE